MNPKQENELQGFSLRSVCWGYRDIFARAIQDLFDDGYLGPQREKSTATFFDLLKRAGRDVYDEVLKSFIESLNPRTRWLLDLPGIFADVVEMGRWFTEYRRHYGSGYFRIMGEGGFGDTPAHVRSLLVYVQHLRDIDGDLAFSFLKGYRRLVDRLEPAEINLYAEEGVEVFKRKKDSGLRFMEGVLKSSEAALQTLSKECRLADVKPALEVLLKALVGCEVEVSDLGNLNSDELIERGTFVVCMYKWLFLPLRIRHFDNDRRNRDWYMLTTVAAAGHLLENSFCRIHGYPEYLSCRDLVGEDILHLNLFQIIEHVRVLRRMRERWPGARSLVEFGFRTEFKQSPPVTAPDRLFFDAAVPQEPATAAAEAIVEAADESVNVFDTASLLAGDRLSSTAKAYPGLNKTLLRSFAFLPDFLYPGTVTSVPGKDVVADLKHAAAHKREKGGEESDVEASRRVTTPEDTEEPGEEEEETAKGAGACFVYDEWSQRENDYLRDYCCVYERRPRRAERSVTLLDVADDVRRVRQLFERLKPALARKEKRLQDGDYLNFDLLVEYVVQRRREPSPKVNFYEKPLINRRDMAAIILLDVSGSTGEDAGEKKVLDIEKRAAVIFAGALSVLGDRFSVCGFSGSGRENCEYFIYKDFEEDWDEERARRILSAYPLQSTRIGPALRHSGYRLAGVEARQRLVILVTDGKPMDSGYDPNTRYAQHDVRVACEENRRQGVHTFAVSTQENSLPDMEVMFPEHRFVILPDVRLLPRVLPRIYMKLTL